MYYDDEVNKPQSELVVERARKTISIKQGFGNIDLIRTVDELSMMVHDSLNRTLLLEVSDRNPSEATIYLESFDEDTLRNESEGWRFLEDTIVSGLIKSDGVLRFVLDLALGPLLLLGGFAAGCWCCRFGFCLKEKGVNTGMYQNRMNAIRPSIPKKPKQQH